MIPYRLLPGVREDLRDIREYYLGNGSPDGARIVGKELLTAFRTIATGPLRGHVRRDLTDRPLRFWNVRSYLIVYNPSARPVEIIAVLHGRRHVGRLLSQRDQ